MTGVYAGGNETVSGDITTTISGGTLDTSKATGNGACLRLQTKVQLILEGSPEITEIYFVGNTLVDATKLEDLETPIAIVKSAAAAFAEVTADLSGAFSAANGTIRYEAGEGGANGKLYLDIA